MFHKLYSYLHVGILSLILAGCGSANINAADERTEQELNDINSLFAESGMDNITISLQTTIERRVRKAAVKITNPSREGHGSGSYFTYKGFYLIITAYHVINDMHPEHIIIVGEDNENSEARLLYKDIQNDIAVLQISEPMQSRRALPLHIMLEEPQVGDILTYTGFPSHHDMLTFQGKIAGTEIIEQRGGRKALLIHTYGWFGSSGSCLFNERGQLVAILWGIDVENYRVPQAQEDLIYASVANSIDLDAVLFQACRQNAERPICKRVIERDILRRFGSE